jgi:hypothetical protein
MWKRPSVAFTGVGRVSTDDAIGAKSSRSTPARLPTAPSAAPVAIAPHRASASTSGTSRRTLVRDALAPSMGGATLSEWRPKREPSPTASAAYLPQRDTRQAMSEERNVEIVRRAYEAFNRWSSAAMHGLRTVSGPGVRERTYTWPA